MSISCQFVLILISKDIKLSEELFSFSHIGLEVSNHFAQETVTHLPKSSRIDYSDSFKNNSRATNYYFSFLYRGFFVVESF